MSKIKEKIRIHIRFHSVWIDLKGPFTLDLKAKAMLLKMTTVVFNSAIHINLKKIRHFRIYFL